MYRYSMEAYNHKNIEHKWQTKWMETNLYETTIETDKEKCYVLDMFPYPSGEGLHVGHPKGYIATDIYSRMKTMRGFEVLHPMGWDAFGLPAEQFALKHKVHPRDAVEKNIKRFKEQLAIIGFNYDWTKEVNTTDPDFYRWTQWIFKQMFKKGLAYESHEPINWCPSCMTGLANEDLEGNQCERCGSVVEKKPIRQWVLRITDYADRMLEGLDALNWPEHIKESQRNWIGKKEGVEFTFTLHNAPEDSITIFTTRADTLYGATFVAISAELAKNWIALGWNVSNEIRECVDAILLEQESIEHSFDKEKKGIFSGIYATNPATQKKIPVYIANYVLGGVGTGAIMAVPAHDERDYDFAKQYGIESIQVITKEGGNHENDSIYTGPGVMVNSDSYNGMNNEEALQKIIATFGGVVTKRYTLQDWVFARQRYWGEPFPIVFDEHKVPYVVADSELPVRLPEVTSYEPTGTGESPLLAIKDWVEVYGYINDSNEFVSLSQDDPRAKLFYRETNTMPQWAGSSWYYLRYIDPRNQDSLIDIAKEKKWSPVDFYVGGAEHATRHLIYARFFHKFLYDIQVVNYDEPFKRLQNVGLIQAEDGRKMSKRFGNVVNPDDIVALYGADTLRIYEMFMGPFDQAVAWSTKNMSGSVRFIEKVWNLSEKVRADYIDSPHALTELHKTIKKCGEDIELFKFNTAVSQMMIFLNSIEKEEGISRGMYEDFLKILAPFAPHITEELWELLGKTTSIHREIWPKYDPLKLVTEEVIIAIQISGKMRGTIETKRDIDDESLKNLVKQGEIYKKYIGETEPKRIIIVKNKIINIVI